MRVSMVCPYCAAELESRACIELLGPRCCWTCLRPIVGVGAARAPTITELQELSDDALAVMRGQAMAYRAKVEA